MAQLPECRIIIRTTWDIYIQIAVSAAVSVLTTLAVLTYLR